MPKSKRKNTSAPGAGGTGGTTTEAIKVFVRVRPPISNEVTEDNAVSATSETSVKLASSKHNLTCTYNHVFSDLTTQEEVFEEVRPLLMDVLGGYNGCIFAYGQTSAGKTHTMLGPNGGTNLNVAKERWGILPRSAEYLFSQLEELSARGNFRYTAKASFLQIYKERLFDLLRSSGSFEGEGEGEGDLKIREIPRLHDPVTGEVYKKDENRPSEVFITGLSEYRVQTASDVLKILAMGTANRHTRSTNFNDTSSRSHALLQLNFEIENKQTDGQTLLYRSKLSLVDLAGSEKMQAMDPNNTSAHHLKELTSINKSLSSLGNVIASLSRKKRLHVPYRDSKLTRVLQDSLGGNTRTILITCVAPTVLHAAESASTLQFADRARNVMLKAKANMVIDDKMLLADAQTEIARLKLLLKQALQKLEGMSEAKSRAVGEFIDDGDTNEELDRVLKENHALRRKNQSLQRAMTNLRLTGVTGGGGGDSSAEAYVRAMRGGVRGVKAEWKSSLVDDDIYRKPPKQPGARGKKGRNNRGDGSDDHAQSLRGREIRTSQSGPLLPVPSEVSSLYFTEEGRDKGGSEDGIGRGSRDNKSNLPGIHKNSKNSSGSSGSSKSKRTQQQRHSSHQSPEPTSDPVKAAILAQVQQANTALHNSLASSQSNSNSGASAHQVAIGSPSKQSMAAVRRGYKKVVQEDDNDSYDEGFEDEAEEEEDEEEEDEDEEAATVDAKQFRKEIEKAKNSKQLRAVEKSLRTASHNVTKELHTDTAALNTIQLARQELERQLKELQMASAAESNDTEAKNCSSPLRSLITPTRHDAHHPTHLISPKTKTPLKPITTTPSNTASMPGTGTVAVGAGKFQQSDVMSSLTSIINKSMGGGSTTSSTSPAKPTSTSVPVAVKKPRTKEEVKDQHPPADLKYSSVDIGRRIELYSYKFATWDIIELLDFNETNGNMHKCRSESDKSEKWIDLKKKPIRGLVITEAED